MHIFDYARDFYTNGFTAIRVAWQIGAALLFAVLVFIGFHMLRRAFSRPLRLAEQQPLPSDIRRLERYELGARLYHWGNFAVIALLLWSGLSFYMPGVIFPLQPYVGFSWLIVHIVLGFTFVALFILHIIFAIWRTKNVRNMWFDQRDWRDLGLTIRYYLGLGSPIAKYGKFDVWQKIYHAFLAIVATAMIGTGVGLFLNAELITSISHEWIRNMRVIHDSGAWAFVAVIIGHVYLRLVVSNWPKLVSMITGDVDAGQFRAEHDWQRWQPHVEERAPPRLPGK